MTERQLVALVASATGESLRTVRDRGFGLVLDDADDPDPTNLRLVLDCPFCRRAVPYPGLASDGSLPTAECLGCDVYFTFALDEVYAAGSPDAGRTMRHGSRVATWAS
jgi:hypothetical protein